MKLYFNILLFFFSSVIYAFSAKPIIDSKMTFEEALAGSPCPDTIKSQLVLLDVQYYSIDGKLHQGQLIINKAIKKDIEEIFGIILKEKFPINKVIPIVKYDWDDDKSMEDNNASSFNYRKIAGTNRISLHSYGRAIDINPFFNPVVHKDGRIEPKGAKRNTKRKGTFTAQNIIVKAFKDRGFRWGGDFESYKDYHHFDKEK